MINIDLSKFRKLEESDKHAVLEHENGHKMTIAKNAISDHLRKQLEELPTNLAKGGYAKFSQKFDPNMGSKASKPSKSSSTMPGNQAAASKAYTEPDDMGTNIPKASHKKTSKHLDSSLPALSKTFPTQYPSYHTTTLLQPILY